MNQKTRRLIANYFTSYFKTQCALFAVSLPILAYWGIPLSLMTMAGNLIFAPLFLIFLVISSLIFTLELLSLPNSLLTNILEYLSKTIFYLLNLGSKTWLWGIRAPSGIIILASLALILFILRHSSLQNPSRSCATSIGLCLVMCITFNGLSTISKSNLEAHPGKKLTIQETAEGLIIEDDGEFGSHSTVDNFVLYELSTWLRRSYGQITIQTLRLLRPNYRSLKATLTLLSFYPIKHIEIMNERFDSPPYLKKYLGRLYGACKKYNTKLIWLPKEARP